MNGHEAESHQLSVLPELLGLDATKHFYHLTSELERRLLEFDAFAGTIREQETEIDVQDVAFDVDKDVPVVTVFDLQYVTNKGVSGETLTEVVFGTFVL